MIPRILILVLFGSASVFTQDYCNPSPCGENSDCTLENGRPACGCKATYIGDPLTKCYHECEKDDDCSSDKGCVNYRCKDPCRGGCGTYASCQVQNHKAICTCPSQYGGDPYTKCIPECTSKEECPWHLSCIDYHCGNPCRERQPCGANTNCEVKQHTAICTCKSGHVGDPLKGQGGCRRRA